MVWLGFRNFQYLQLKDKKMERRRVKFYSIFLISVLASCGNQQMEFDKKKWNERDDIFYVYREKMATDLMKNHLKIGMTMNDVLNHLGNSENHQNNSPNTIGYEIMVDYGWNIDPQNGKTLFIEFTNDSVVKNFRLDEWKH